MHHGDIDKSTAKGLLVLQERIKKAKIPPSKLDETLNIATWNVREFGKKRRLKSSLHYIAEIIGQFDLVSLVELRDDTRDLAEVISYLGPYWDVVYSDYVTDGGGNGERQAFVFDRRAVTFTGLASNVTPNRKKDGDEYIPAGGWWRPPYMGSFRAGNFDFVVMIAHIRWATEKARVPELSLLAKWIAKRIKQRFVDDKDILVMGDFNIPSIQSPLFEAIASEGLEIPKALLGAKGSDLAKGKRYDQILHLPKFTHAFSNQGGVLDFYEGDHRPLFPGKKMEKQAFTYQLSDHLPLWVQVNTDNDKEMLEQLLNQKRR